MAGRGAPPKPDSSRARRNRATTAATLESQKAAHERHRGERLPKLPARPPDAEPWDKRTVAWWRETMRSPMAGQYLDADLPVLHVAFELIDEFYATLETARGTKGRRPALIGLALEIRQQIARFGLTPRDRLSLHWAVPADEEDDPDGPRAAPPPMVDPRFKLGQESA